MKSGKKNRQSKPFDAHANSIDPEIARLIIPSSEYLIRKALEEGFRNDGIY